MDRDDKISAAIAEQAAEWFVADDAEWHGNHNSNGIVTWLKASPVHVREFLGVSVAARDLRALKEDPAYSIEALLDAVRSDEDNVRPLPIATAPRGRPSWRLAGAVLASCAVLTLGALLWRNSRLTRPAPAAVNATAWHFTTGHGGQMTRLLPDHSVLHLNTDSDIHIQYSGGERLATLVSGEASFEVVHDAARAFRVLAGPAQVVDIGTKFNVRLEPNVAWVTVLEGRVGVEALPPIQTSGARPAERVEVGADGQAKITQGQWPPELAPVDALRATSWLHRQISFDHEPLERVAAEYNRYARKPIQIVTPALRTLLVSGMFATDDPEEFIAFLRSLKGVRVAVAATQIRVSADE